MPHGKPLTLLMGAALLLSGAEAPAPPRATGRAVLEELNRARQDPKAYAAHLRVFLGRFQGRRLEMPGEIALITEEGEPAVREAIAFLEGQAPLQPLGFAEGLARAAEDHVLAQGPTGATGHTGPKGDRMTDRIDARGTWSGSIGEAISYGPPDARGIVVQLLIDDGVPNRGHRKALFNPAFRMAGAAVGAHARYGHMAVLDFAEGFRP